MNMNLDLKFDPKALWSQLLKLKKFLLSLMVLVLIGLTAYQVSSIMYIEPDQDSIEAERVKLKQSRIHFDQKTIDSLNKRSSMPGQPDLSNLGRSDPFTP